MWRPLNSSLIPPGSRPGLCLWEAVEARPLPAPYLLGLLTLVGATRFGIAMLCETIAFRSLARGLRWLLSGIAIGSMTWFSLRWSGGVVQAVLEVSGTLLAAVGAVLTADLLSGADRHRPGAHAGLGGRCGRAGRSGCRAAGDAEDGARNGSGNGRTPGCCLPGVPRLGSAGWGGWGRSV